MPRADVGVVGGGLAGLTAAIVAADAGARVHVLAAGQATSHWASGAIDVAVTPGATTPAEGVRRLAEDAGHPYRFLGPLLPEALETVRAILAAEGLDLIGELDDPLAPLPTAVGATRPVAIVPDGMSAAMAPWRADETLVVCGPAGFRDFWPEAIAASLRNPASWRGAARPGRIEPVAVALPDLGRRHNLSGLDIARAFDDPDWRDRALDAIAAAVDRLAPSGGRIALPAVLGLHDHAAILASARQRLPLVPFEVPLVPPSVPGLRMHAALRSALRRRGGRIQIGEPVRGTVGEDRRVRTLVAPAAARTFALSVEAVILATGGIAAGGIVAGDDRTLVETVLGLPVEPPEPGAWLRSDPFDPAGHPLETAGIRTDDRLRPLGPMGRRAVAENVRVCGSLLAGQRYLRQRCGEGVAIASGLLAGRELGGSPANDDRRDRGGRSRRFDRPQRRCLPEVQRLQHGLPGRAGDRSVPGPKVRRAAGPALPARHDPLTRRRPGGSLARSNGRLLLRLRDVLNGLPGRRQDRRDEQPRPGPATHRPPASPT
jgi:glycerol-3-phosphate dehydrogenase subunit B